ncbi:MAG: CAP domain-containing protein [Bacteroidia bacterium]|nr:CAP domain-containing protein [Bacteroidia bacterium]
MGLLSKIIFTLVFLSFSIKTVFAQKAWTPEMVEKANTAKNIDYLTEEEKLVVFYCNLVRMNPPLFMDTYAKKYIDSTKNNTSFTKSLIKTLGKTENMEVLYPSKKLFVIAKAHASDFGKSGGMGHGNFKKRFEKYGRECNCEVGENCDYGYSKALDITMRLLIDEKISNLAHRKNILNPNYKNSGVSIMKHKKYSWHCVIDYSANSATD